MSEVEKIQNFDTSSREAVMRPGFWSVLLTAFTTVFFAELGDKTQIATLLLSAHSGNPSVVFIGAAIALICSSLIAVMLGQWLATNFPTHNFKYITGFLMLGLGLWLAFQASEALIPNLI